MRKWIQSLLTGIGKESSLPEEEEPFRLILTHVAGNPGFIATLTANSHGIVEIHNRDDADPKIVIVEAGDIIRCDLKVHVE